jgi:hypothetical protein
MSGPHIIEQRKQAADVVTQALDDLSAGWGVLHGAEGYPDSVGRDLDVLVSPEKVGEIAREVSRKLELAGWQTSIIDRPWKVSQVIASRECDAGIVAFEADLIGYQMWRGVVLASGPPDPSDIYLRGNSMRCDAWGGFVKRVLIQSLASNWSKLESRRDEMQPYPEEIPVVTSRLTSVCGAEKSDRYINALRSGDLAEIAKASVAVRTRILKQLLRPSRFGRQPARWLVDKISERSLHAAHAPLVLLSVPDAWPQSSMEEVKSRIADACRESLVFPSVKVIAGNLTGTSRHIARVFKQSAFTNLQIASIRSTGDIPVALRKQWIMPINVSATEDGQHWTFANGESVHGNENSVISIFLPRLMSMHHALNHAEIPNLSAIKL